MLQRLGKFVADAYERALAAEYEAATAATPLIQKDYETLARSWRKLAQSVEFFERLQHFLADRTELEEPAVAKGIGDEARKEAGIIMRSPPLAAQEWLFSVNEQIDKDEKFLATIRRERALLVDQIRKSEQTIEQSKQLIQKLDELLARSGLKP
jgi:hypothetical protein